jgi:hypothetical protein
MRNFSKALTCSLFIIFTLSLTSAQAQTATNPYQPDQRLYQVMDKTYLDQMFIDKPELILYYNYYLDHSFYIARLDNEKPVNGIDIHTVQWNPDMKVDKKFDERTFDAKTFNVLKYNFARDLDRFTTYVWKEAGIALVFLPQRHFQEQFQDYSKSINQ